MAGSAEDRPGMAGNFLPGVPPSMHSSQGSMYGGMPPNTFNPMYGNLGMQPGLQTGMHGMSGMPGVGMFNNPYMGNPTQVPFLQPPVYNLTPKGRAKDFKEGGFAVKFDTFTGAQDRQKALIFLQHFDAAYS